MNKNGDFVPPRDEMPCLGRFHRPATGHLYRFTICVVFCSAPLIYGLKVLVAQTSPNRQQKTALNATVEIEV